MLKFNGETPKKIFYNGMKVAKVVYRTFTVWVDKVLATLTNNSNVSQRQILLTDSVGEDIVDYKLYSHSYFNGTPTPEAPVKLNTSGDYDEATGKYKFVINSSSHNVFRMDLMPTEATDTYSKDGDNIVIDLTNDTSRNDAVIDITFGEVCPELKVGDKIVWYCETTSPNKNVWLSNGFYIELGKAYTVTNNMLTSKIHLYGKGGEKHTTNKIRVYNNVKEYSIYLDEPLRRYASDDYVDYIDFANQKVIRKCGSLVLTGQEEGWYINEIYTTDSIICLTNPKQLATYNPSYTGGLSNKFVWGASEKVNTFRFSSSIYLFLSLDGTIYTKPENIATTKMTDELRAAIAGTEIIYIRKTPIEEAIELPVIETEEGENLFSYPINNPIKKAEVSYYKFNEEV